MDEMTQEMREYADLILENKTLDKNQIELIFPKADYYSGHPTIRKYMADKKYELHKQSKQKVKRSEAKAFPADVTASALACMKLMMFNWEQDPNWECNPGMINMVKFALDGYRAYDVEHNKQTAQKEVMGQDAGIQHVRILENRPKSVG